MVIPGPGTRNNLVSRELQPTSYMGMAPFKMKLQFPRLPGKQ